MGKTIRRSQTDDPDRAKKQEQRFRMKRWKRVANKANTEFFEKPTNEREKQ